VAKRPLPRLNHIELAEEVERLLHRRFQGDRGCEKAARWLLTHFTGWDLEAMIEELRNELPKQR
jgi:hypothetical protein